MAPAPEVDLQQQLKDLAAKVSSLELKVKENENRGVFCDRCMSASERGTQPADIAGTSILVLYHFGRTEYDITAGFSIVTMYSSLTYNRA